jgi:hypothetical protein
MAGTDCPALGKRPKDGRNHGQNGNDLVAALGHMAAHELGPRPAIEPRRQTQIVAFRDITEDGAPFEPP